MLYKNKKGLVHNLSPEAELTKRWLKQGNLTPLNDAEKKEYAKQNSAKVAVKQVAKPAEEELPPAPSREEMDVEHNNLFGKAPMATMKDDNLWKKILDKREEVAAKAVDPNATEGK